MRSLSLKRIRGLRRRAFTLLELVIVLGIILLLLGLVLGVGSIVVGQSEQRQLRASMAIVDGAIAEFESQTGRPIVFEGASAQNRWGHCGYALKYDDNCDVDTSLNTTNLVYYDVPYRPLDPDSGLPSWQGQNVSNYVPWEDNLAYAPRQWMAATLDVLSENTVCAEMIAKADPTLIHAVQFMEGSGSSSSGLRSVNIKEFVDPWGTQVYIVFPGRLWVACDGDNVTQDSDGTIRTTDEARFGICRNRRPLMVSAGPDGQIGIVSSAIDQPNYEYTLDNVYSYEPWQE